jgi:hypothetical protein
MKISNHFRKALEQSFEACADCNKSYSSVYTVSSRILPGNSYSSIQMLSSERQGIISEDRQVGI